MAVKEAEEASEQLPPAVPVSKPSAVETTEVSKDTEEEEEKPEHETEQIVQGDLEAEEVEVRLAASKPSEVSLDLSEVVDICDDTDKTYEHKIDEVIMIEAREEMEGEALEVCVMRQSPETDKEGTFKPDTVFHESVSQVAPETVHDVQFKGELYEQIGTEEDTFKEIPDQTQKGEIQTEDQLQMKAQISQEVIEGVAAEQELSSPGSKVSDISPVDEEKVEPVPVTEYADSTQRESYALGGEPEVLGQVTKQDTYEQMSYAEFKAETVITTVEEVRQQHIVTKEETTYVEDEYKETAQKLEGPTEKLIAAMPDVPLKSPHISSSEDEGGDSGEEDVGESCQRPSQEEIEGEPSPVEETPPDVDELDQEIEEQDALTAALMSQYQVGLSKEEQLRVQAPEEAEYAVPDLREGESDYESEEEKEVASETFDEQEEDRDEEDAVYKTPEDETDYQLSLQVEMSEKQQAEKYEEELAEKQTEDQLEEVCQLGTEQTLQQTEVCVETHVKDTDTMSQSVDSTEAQMASSGEGLLLEPYPQEYDIMAISGGTEGDQEREPDFTDMFECPAGEVSDHDDLYERYSDESEEELKPLKIPVEDSPTEQPTPSDFFGEPLEEAERPDIDEYRQSPGYDRSPEEEVYRSPTEEYPEDRPFDSPLQEELVEEDKVVPFPGQQEVKSQIEQAPVSGILAELQEIEQHAVQEHSEEEQEDDLEQYEEEIEEEQFAGSEETVQNVLQATELTEQYVDRKELFTAEQRDVSVLERTAEEQKDVEELTAHDEKEVEEEWFARSEETVQSVQQDTELTEQYVDRKELFTAEQRDVSVLERTTDEQKEEDELTARHEKEIEEEQFVSSEEAVQSVQQDTELTEQYVDRKELFTAEQRDVSVTERTTDEQVPERTTDEQVPERTTDEQVPERTTDEQVPERTTDEQVPETITDEQEYEDELTANVYVDRVEQFIEEPIETLTAGGDSTAGGFVSGTTDLDSAGAAAAEPVIEGHRLSAQSSLSEQDSHYPEYIDEHHLSLHPPLYPSSSTEVQDRSGTPSDLETEEPAQNGLQSATGASGSYTSDITSGSQSYLSESTVSRMSESDYTSHSETWAASECTMTGSEFEPEGRIIVDTCEVIYTEEKTEDRHPDLRESREQMDTLDRPMSPSDFTLITSHDQDRMMQVLDLQPGLPREELSDEEDEEGEDEMERDSLQSESDEMLSDDEQGSERPPSPTDYTLIASQDQEALTQALGLQQEALDIDTEAITVRGMEEDQEFYQQMRLQAELETQSTGSSEQAVIQLLDSVDNNTVSNISSDREFEKDSDVQREDLEVAPLEPSAPYMSPSSEVPHSVGDEDLYQPSREDYPYQPPVRGDTEIAQFGIRQTEFYTTRTASTFEELYSSEMVPEAAAFSGEGDSIDRADTSSDDGYLSHRVVMKKEVHKKTMIRPDGQEETVIKEESQIHQDSEPPEELRDSMQQIINQFMEDNPPVPAIEEDVDEGTEV